MNSYGSVSLVSGAIYKLLRHLNWFSPEQDPDPGQESEPEPDQDSEQDPEQDSEQDPGQDSDPDPT
jgi:hypothetical protein